MLYIQSTVRRLTAQTIILFCLNQNRTPVISFTQMIQIILKKPYASLHHYIQMDFYTFWSVAEFADPFCLESLLMISMFFSIRLDMKILKHMNTFSDCIFLQEDLNSLEQYCYRNKLDLNVSKCLMLTFTRKSILLSYDYHLQGVRLSRVQKIKNLHYQQGFKSTFLLLL